MLRLRPYKTCDAETIVSWIKDEYAFRQWCADRYDHYPITAEDMNAQYNGLTDADWFYPMTAFDENGVVGHLIMRFTDDEKTVLRFGFIIVDDAKRGQGYGKEMLDLALKMAFEVMKAETVTLGVFENNPAAYYCYKSAGFQDVPRAEPEYYHVMDEDWKCLDLRIDAGEKNGGINIPDSIMKLTAGKKYSADYVGMSGSQIRIFDDSVLKIVNYRKENEETIKMMHWLEGKLPVPKVICSERDSEYQYLLMSKVSGRMSCDEYYLEHPQELLLMLSEALKMLWSIDISDCPRNRDIDEELREARYRVENHLVDFDNVDPTTFGEGGFKDPEELLKWLENNRPDYEPVLSHGDFCLPNIFIENERISGFIDLGDTGIGDRWRDIALCYRSLKDNFDGTFGGKVYSEFSPDMLFDVLGVSPNPEKLKYYILLDELF